MTAPGFAPITLPPPHPTGFNADNERQMRSAIERAFAQIGQRLGVDKHLPWVDVDDYKAKGDGVTDDAASLQAAIDAAAAIGGARVLLHDVTYLCGTGLTWDGNVRIEGPTRGGATIRASAAITIIAGEAAGVTSVSGYIKNVTLDGDDIATIGLRVKNLAWFALENVHILSCTTSGLDNEGALTWEARACHFTNCPIGADFYASADAPPNLVALRDCVISGNATWGVRMQGGQLFVMDKCDVEANGTAGDAATGGIQIGAMCPIGTGVACELSRCWLELNSGGAGIQFQTGSGLHVVSQSQVIAGTRTYGIDVATGVHAVMNQVVATNAATADYRDVAGAESTLNYCLFSSKSIGSASTSEQPDPLGSGQRIFRDTILQETGATRTGAGAVSAPHNTATTLFSANPPGMYVVVAYIAGAGTSYHRTGFVVSDGSTASLTDSAGGANMAISVSGSDVQGTQTSGATNPITYVYFRIG